LPQPEVISIETFRTELPNSAVYSYVPSYEESNAPKCRTAAAALPSPKYSVPLSEDRKFAYTTVVDHAAST
jgi:hypothetical protein